MWYLQTKNWILFFLGYDCINHCMADTQEKKTKINFLHVKHLFLKAELTNVGQEERR